MADNTRSARRKATGQHPAPQRGARRRAGAVKAAALAALLAPALLAGCASARRGGLSEADAAFLEGRRSYEDKAYPKAAAAFQKAAALGHTRAQYNLALCYMNGRGVEQDYAQAAAWARQAAEAGLAGAQYLLGLCYERGQGVERDEALALEWYRKAAAGGNELARGTLERRAGAASGGETPEQGGE